MTVPDSWTQDQISHGLLQLERAANALEMIAAQLDRIATELPALTKATWGATGGV